MEKSLCIFFLVFLLFPVISLAQEIPTLTKYVNDYANVLSDSEKAQINDLCAQIESNWTVEIAVLTVNTTQPLTIEDYAVQTFEKNGVGKGGTNNGLLIVVATEDRKWRFEVGYGLEPIINDAKAGKIGRAYLVPNFQNENYGEGLYQAIDAVRQVVANSGDDSFIANEESNDNLAIVVFFIIFLAFIPFVIILRLAFTEKCPKCGARMNCRYEGDRMTCECPKCGKKTRKKISKNHWFFLIGGIGGSGSWSGGGSSGGGFGGGGSGGGGSSGGW